jgi:hypothetical protein
MDTRTSRAADAAGEPTAPGRLWLGLANALAIELVLALVVALLVALLGGGLPC